MSEKKSLLIPILLALGCYLIWGLQPIYWDLLSKFDSMFILCTRVVMAAVLMCLYLAATGRFSELISTLKDKQTMKFLIPSALFLAADWGLFIWAVATGQIVDMSLGYYFNPLIIFLSGLILVREKGHPLEYGAVGLACTGIIINIVRGGSFPILALLIAFIWPIYATVKRFAKADAIVSFTIETLLMLPFALIAALIFFRGDGGLGAIAGIGDVFLLLGAGLVTAMPMILYNMVVNDLPFKMVGILQYACTSITFLCGVIFMNETVTSSKLMMFIFIWAGLVLYTAGSFMRQARQHNKLKQ